METTEGGNCSLKGSCSLTGKTELTHSDAAKSADSVVAVDVSILFRWGYPCHCGDKRVSTAGGETSSIAKGDIRIVEFNISKFINAFQ